MSLPAVSKWDAFLASLALPGAGHLVAGNPRCLVWFAAVGGLVIACAWAADTIGAGPIRAVQMASLATLGLCSAEAAKRRLEPAGPWPETPGNVVHVCGGKIQGRSIWLGFEVDVSRPAAELWNRVSDLPTFLTIDPFHDKVHLMRTRPAAGVDVALWHNAFGHRFLRFGRILRWNEGHGYAFSDLSAANPRTGFPHVFFVTVESLTSNRSRARIEIRGKWTSRWIPVRVGCWWIRYVCAEHARLIRKAM